MTLSRRHALRVLGAAGVGAVVAPAAFWTTRRPDAALAPWDLAGSYDDLRLNAASFALLAPNPHNLQPWMVELVGQDRLRLYRDPNRALPETDPFDRQIMIGLGCFLEQLRIAASLTGHAVAFDLFPEGDGGPVAEAVFQTGAARDPLAGAILARRSCKAPYEARAVDGVHVSELELFADIYTDPETVARLQALTWEAYQIEVTTPHTLQESIDVMRMGKAEINANPDGIHLGGAFLESLMIAGMLSREGLQDPDSLAFRQGLADYKAMLEATPAYAVLVSDGNTRVDQIETGRRWLRLNLKTTQLGLGLHPVSQALQEYPEMAGPFGQAHDILAGSGQTVQMLGRLGYGPQTARTPRWPVEAKQLHV